MNVNITDAHLYFQQIRQGSIEEVLKKLSNGEVVNPDKVIIQVWKVQ